MPFEMTVHERALKDLGSALRKEADGNEIRKDLIKQLRTAMTPARDAARQSIRSMSSHSGHAGMSLRRAVATKTVIEVRLSGMKTGVRLRTKKTPGARGFRNAPKRLNSQKGFRHPVFGNRERWVSQLGKPRWFDDPIKSRRAEFRKAVLEVMQTCARRIKMRVR